MNKFASFVRSYRLLSYLSLSVFTSVILLKLNLVQIEAAKAEVSQNSQPVLQIKNSNLISLQNKEKPRIAILDFDFSSISSNYWYSIFRGDSKGVSDILVNKLVKDNNFVVVERSQLEAILREQNLGLSGRVDASTAAQVGRILGVEAVVIGSITQFDLERQNSGISIPIFGGGQTKAAANVRLNIRVVDTSTAAILFTAEGKASESQSDGNISVPWFSVGASTSNEEKLLVLATEKAIDKVVLEMNANAEKLATLPKALPTVNAVVADVTGNTVIINKGKSDAYRVGMKLSIERVVKVVKDPSSGKVIRQVTSQVGVIQITDVDAGSSVGNIISGGKFKVGDIAKPVQ